MIRDIITYNFEFGIRLIIAGACGAMIGYERTAKHKEAGLKTHVIVALASALMMIISKYAFYDMSLEKFDGSRVAAQIVSGVGFLGAGVIFVRDKVTVSGLTTAAGIWGTAGIGMAVGAGLYTLALMASLLMILSNMFLKNTISNVREQVTLIIEIIVGDLENQYLDINRFLDYNHFRLVSMKTTKINNKNKIQLFCNCFADEFNIDKVSEQLLNKNIEKFNIVKN